MAELGSWLGQLTNKSGVTDIVLYRLPREEACEKAVREVLYLGMRRNNVNLQQAGALCPLFRHR